VKGKMPCKHIVTILFLAMVVCAQTPNNNTSSVSVRRFVAPVYPVTAWLARVEGTTVTEIVVKTDGAVDSVKVVSAHPLFHEALKTALKQWSFQTSTAATLQITTRFQLDADCHLTGSREPEKLYYVKTQVSADLPSNVEVRTCLPIVTIDTNQSQHR
jgi:TonB family protein